MFTQQHYETLAKVFRDARRKLTADLDPNTSHGQTAMEYQCRQEGISEVQVHLMNALKQDNPKFKELLFIGAASEHAPDPKRTRR